MFQVFSLKLCYNKHSGTLSPYKVTNQSIFLDGVGDRVGVSPDTDSDETLRISLNLVELN